MAQGIRPDIARLIERLDAAETENDRRIAQSELRRALWSSRPQRVIAVTIPIATTFAAGALMEWATPHNDFAETIAYLLFACAVWGGIGLGYGWARMCRNARLARLNRTLGRSLILW